MNRALWSEERPPAVEQYGQLWRSAEALGLEAGNWGWVRLLVMEIEKSDDVFEPSFLHLKVGCLLPISQDCGED